MEKAWSSSWSKAYNNICETWWSSVMAWACMASSGTGYWCLVMMWQRTESGRKNSEVYRNILSAQIQTNGAKLIGWRFIVQMDDDPKQFLKVKTWNILPWPSQSPDLNPTEHAFHLLKTKLKAERPTNKQQLKSAAVKAWQSITKEENQSLVMSMSSRLMAVIACKGFSTTY